MAEPSANAELGDPAYGDADSVTYEAGESITAGDAVDISGGVARPANSGDTGVILVGIAGDDAAAGENVTVYTGGAIVASAGGSVTAGDEVGASTTDGQLVSGTNARGWVALTDSGAMQGLSHGAGLGTNAAVIDLG